MPEVWKSVVGYKREYEVSSLGNIRRVAPASGTRPGRLLKPKVRKDGRHAVILYRNRQPRTFLWHRVVARAFLGPCRKGREVNHRDGNPANNRTTNLEYVTSGGNKEHAYRVLGRKPAMARLTEEDVRTVLTRRREGEVQQSIADDFGVPQSLISAVCSGKRYARVAPDVPRIPPRRSPKR